MSNSSSATKIAEIRKRAEQIKQGWAFDSAEGPGWMENPHALFKWPKPVFGRQGPQGQGGWAGKTAASMERRHPHDVAGTVLGSLSGAGLGLAGGAGLGMLATDDIRKIIASGLLGAGVGSVGGGYLGHKMPEIAGGVAGGLSGANLGATVGNELGALADASPETKAALRAVLGLGGLGGGAYLGHRLLSRD